jgi:hypothetical protein
VLLVVLVLSLHVENLNVLLVQGAREAHLSVYPRGCDKSAAAQCEYEFLLCKLFNGPANDQATLCNCAKEFYGSCLRLAGCETAHEVGPLTNHEVYMATCVAFIMQHNCPDPLICSINCASETQIDPSTTKIIPFNNYGQYYLRTRICLTKIQEQRLQRYSVIQQVTCTELSDFNVCNRWVPPSSFVPVALPINTTYIEIDSCIITNNGSYSCLTQPGPAQVYGNSFLFPKSFEVTPTNLTTCRTDSDCLGSFCDKTFRPSICSPKTIQQALGEGADYMNV